MSPSVSQSVRSTWWSITAFNEEIALLEDKAKFPDYVKCVYGGREECPETGKVHFQGAVQFNSQVRMSTIKKWLPTAHLEPARNADALRKYAMKDDTAIGEKTAVANPNTYMKLHDVMRVISEVYDYDMDDYETAYWKAINTILYDHPTWAGMLQNPANCKFFEKTRFTWRRLAEANAYSITAVATSDCPDECVNCGNAFRAKTDEAIHCGDCLENYFSE